MYNLVRLVTSDLIYIFRKWVTAGVEWNIYHIRLYVKFSPWPLNKCGIKIVHWKQREKEIIWGILLQIEDKKSKLILLISDYRRGHRLLYHDDKSVVTYWILVLATLSPSSTRLLPVGWRHFDLWLNSPWCGHPMISDHFRPLSLPVGRLRLDGRRQQTTA